MFRGGEEISDTNNDRIASIFEGGIPFLFRCQKRTSEKV